MDAMTTVQRLARPAFHVVAVLEALSWVGLLAAMYSHYVAGGSRAGIELFGPVHGGVFLAYVVVALVAARVLRWRWWVALLALAASLPPLASVVFDVVASRRGWLARGSGVGASTRRTAVPAA